MKNLLIFILIVLLIANLVFIYLFMNPELSGKFFEELEFKSKREKGFVTKIIDGDTIVVNGEHIRLLGIDTDERGEPCYKEAKERLSELVLNKEVEMEKELIDKDQYDRALRYIFIMNNSIEVNINLKLVEEGLAIARFYEDRKYKDEILEAENRARENKIGCKWKDL